MASFLNVDLPSEDEEDDDFIADEKEMDREDRPVLLTDRAKGGSKRK
jgi:hypothetical protein